MSCRALLTALVLGGGLAMGLAARADPAPAPVWVVDPARAGPHLPPVGGSGFDAVFATTTREGRVIYRLPFPFDKLLARLDAQLAQDPASPLPPAKRVLIPLGRSLQRSAAAPDYFRFPRVVVGVDAPPLAGAPLLKDRLYIGYQEKSALLEVISYNEAAGRFEFQLVKDYRAGATPRVVQANRTLCMACHQNGAPIFSRPLWDETNANPQLAALLEKVGRSFYGIPPGRGVDVPYALDNAVRRANRFALTQRLWQEGCGGGAAGRECRAGLFEAALRLQLAEGRSAGPDPAFDAAVGRPLRAAAARGWPGGLALGRSDLPNRNPLAGVSAALSSAPSPGLAPGLAPGVAPGVAHIAARFDPLAPRPPDTLWRGDAPEALAEAVAGVAEFVVDGDWGRLQAALARRAAALPRLSARLSCEKIGASAALRCRGPGSAALVLEPAARRLEGLSLAGETPLPAIALKPLGRGRWRPAPGPQRLAGGEVLEQLDLGPLPEGATELTLRLRDERRALAGAMALLRASPEGVALLAEQPLPGRRLIAALLSALGEPRPPGASSHEPAARQGLPAEPLPAPDGEAVAAALAGFEAWCGACHRSAEAFPPNFLSGPPRELEARLRQCAPRIYVRLAMAARPPGERDKTPMPPETLLPAFGSDPAGWAASPARAALEGVAAGLLKEERGRLPALDELLAGGYEALRPCLAARP